MKNFFDNILKWSALITASYLIIATIRATLYYSYFGIDIYTYIETAEIFTIYLPSTLFTVLITAFPVLFLIFINMVPPDHPEYTYYNVIPYIFLIGIAAFVMSRYFFNSFGLDSETINFIHHSISYGFILLLSFFTTPLSILTIILIVLERKKAKKDNSIFQFPKAYAYTVIILVMCHLFLVSVIETNSVDITNPVNYEKMVVIMNKDTIRTNNDLRYIGKTRNYIFFYSKENAASTIYPMTEVLKIFIENSFRKIIVKPQKTKIKVNNTLNSK